LNCIHDIALLCQKRIAQIGGPLDVVSQPLYYFRQTRQSLNTWVPRLFRHGIRERFVLETLVPIQPLLKLDDLERIRRRRQGLRQHWIWV
jgi:hypothetical protein